MKTLTNKETEILIILFKDFNADYNANSISKVLKITPRGALKNLKHLQEQNLVVGREFGRAVFYKINFNDEYIVKLLPLLLMGESREKASRWLSEFAELRKAAEILIIFGSVIESPKTANDIDLLAVFKKEKYSLISKIIENKQVISSKPIHIIKQTPNDFVKNLRERNDAVIEILKKGYVLYGYEKLVEVLKGVTRV